MHLGRPRLSADTTASADTAASADATLDLVHNDKTGRAGGICNFFFNGRLISSPSSDQLALVSCMPSSPTVPGGITTRCSLYNIFDTEAEDGREKKPEIGTDFGLMMDQVKDKF